MKKDTSIKKWFGTDLAKLLSSKIEPIYPSFDTAGYIDVISKNSKSLEYTGRLELHADTLRQYLPKKYTDALKILMQILGPENTEETGMFKNFYWIMPIGKFVEKYGLENFSASIRAIEQITKRNTGEYAIRPFAKKYPEKTLVVCKKWAESKNFHLRRLASEGLRPKLPWAQKLDVWKDNPTPIFEILELLKEDEIKFVKKSVANHLRDWIKVNSGEAQKIIRRWSKSKNEHTQWILKHAQR